MGITRRMFLKSGGLALVVLGAAGGPGFWRGRHKKRLARYWADGVRCSWRFSSGAQWMD